MSYLQQTQILLGWTHAKSRLPVTRISASVIVDVERRSQVFVSIMSQGFTPFPSVIVVIIDY